MELPKPRHMQTSQILYRQNLIIAQVQHHNIREYWGLWAQRGGRGGALAGCLLVVVQFCYQIGVVIGVLVEMELRRTSSETVDGKNLGSFSSLNSPTASYQYTDTQIDSQKILHNHYNPKNIKTPHKYQRQSQPQYPKHGTSKSQFLLLFHSFNLNNKIAKPMLRESHIYSQHNPKLSEHDPQFPFIPLTMFLMMPATRDDYYVGQGKGIRRFIFEGTGKDTYTPFELEKYKEFVEYWEKNKTKLPANIVNNPFWDYPWKMRWLTSEQFNVKNTIKAMQMHSTYLSTNRLNVTPNAQKLLKQGMFYVSGRDAYYRPILVFDIDKMIRANLSEEELIESQKFFFEVVLSQFLLPGQVETWVAIIDVGYQNLTSLVGPMKASFAFLANTFRNRMRIAYVVRIPGALSFLWMIIKNFLHEDTAKKINFLDDQAVAPLLEFTNPSQLEVKYGGTQPQITEFWPIRNTKRLQELKLLNFSHPEVVGIPISQEAYKTKYEKGKLEGHKISKILIEDQKEKERASQKKEHDKLMEAQKLKSKQESLEKTMWPEEYRPLACPSLRTEDCIAWQKLFN